MWSWLGNGKKNTHTDTHAQIILQMSFLQKHSLLMHIQHKYAFRVSATNSLFSFYLHFHVSPADRSIRRDRGCSLRAFLRRKKPRARCPGAGFPRDLSKWPAPLLRGSSRSQREVRGHLKQHGVSAWHSRRQTGSNGKLTQLNGVTVGLCVWRIDKIPGANYSWLFRFWISCFNTTTAVYLDCHLSSQKSARVYRLRCAELRKPRAYSLKV